MEFYLWDNLAIYEYLYKAREVHSLTDINYDYEALPDVCLSMKALELELSE